MEFYDTTKFGSTVESGKRRYQALQSGDCTIHGGLSYLDKQNIQYRDLTTNLRLLTHFAA